LGVSRQNVKKKIGNQYTTRWQGLAELSGTGTRVDHGC